jgi:hypothetical protein
MSDLETATFKHA